jgi:hypothetical protein
LRMCVQQQAEKYTHKNTPRQVRADSGHTACVKQTSLCLWQNVPQSMAMPCGSPVMDRCITPAVCSQTIKWRRNTNKCVLQWHSLSHTLFTHTVHTSRQANAGPNTYNAILRVQRTRKPALSISPTPTSSFAMAPPAGAAVSRLQLVKIVTKIRVAGFQCPN